MAYATYTTEAIVCGTYARNTADASYRLFTDSAGMLFATARSVREERSRQRYALQDFARLRVSLVRGKAGWRVGSCVPRENYYQAATNRATRGGVVAVTRTLQRFVQSEEVLPKCFDVTQATLERLVLDPAVAQWLPQYYAVWLLSTLGYVPSNAIPDTVSLTTAVDTWEHDPASDPTVRMIINEATSASQL